jgi:putative transposase
LKRDLALRLRDIIRDICTENKMSVVKGNIRPNHTHILVNAPSYLSSVKIMQLVKGKSSYRLQLKFPTLHKKYWSRHLWSRGYFGSSVGAVNEDQIKQYIENQSNDPGSFKCYMATRPPRLCESDGGQVAGGKVFKC